MRRRLCSAVDRSRVYRVRPAADLLTIRLYRAVTCLRHAVTFRRAWGLHRCQNRPVENTTFSRRRIRVRPRRPKSALTCGFVDSRWGGTPHNSARLRVRGPAPRFRPETSRSGPLLAVQDRASESRPHDRQVGYWLRLNVPTSPISSRLLMRLLSSIGLIIHRFFSVPRMGGTPGFNGSHAVVRHTNGA